MTNWRQLIVSNAESVWGELGELVDNAPANLDNAVIEDGKITVWPGFMLSVEGEEPDWDTPREEIDWTGFADALNRHNSQPIGD